MNATPDNPPGPADDAAVDQAPGTARGLPESRPAGGGHEREVGVGPAVERGPAERSSEGDPVPENPHTESTDDLARSTDDL